MSNIMVLFHNPPIEIPSTDEQLRSAITALQASTEAIDQQTRTINSQAAYLTKLKANDNAANHRRCTHASHLNQREAAEIQHVTFANEQLLDHLRADIQSESESMGKDIKSVHSVVSQVLNADDRTLAELSDLTTRRPIPTVDTGDRVQRLAQLTRALQNFRVQTVKNRLDCTYLRRLNDLSPPEGVEPPHDPDASSSTLAVQEIQQDLGLLYDEIDDVVTMAVRHEHAGPIEATLHQIDAAQETEARTSAEQPFAHFIILDDDSLSRCGIQVHSRLSSLTESLEQLSSRLETLHMQRTTLRTLRNLALRTESLQQQQSHPPPRPLVRPTRAGGATSDTTATNTNTTSHPALSRLLQHLSLQDTTTTTTTTNPAPSQIPLHTAVQTQTRKLQSRSTEHISTILTASENTAASRREILDALAGCVVSETSEKNARDLADLEAAVDSARLQMERGAVIAP